MVFVLKPLTQSQQQGSDIQEEYKHKSRLVICGNFASWGEHSTTTTNLDPPLLRLMLSLACSKETTWSSIDITSAFLNADIHDDDTVLVTPPPILVKMDIVKPNTVWHVEKAIYGLQEAPRLWQKVQASPHWGFHPLIIVYEAMNGQPDCISNILGYVGVYVDDLLIAGPRSLNDSMIRAVQDVWKTSAPEHLGPDPDCVPILRFLGMSQRREE